MTFTNDLSPFVFRFEIGGQELGLRWYGLAYLLGFVISYLALRSAVQKGRIRNLEAKGLDALMTYLIVGVIAGGRIGFVVQNLGRLAEDPMFPFKIWEGGMAFFGGLGGVILATVLFCRIRGLDWFELADELTVPAALGLGLGRIANFINAELWGRPTGADWGVIYPEVDQVPRHPSELYEMTSHFLLAGILFLIARHWSGWREAKAGRLSAVFLIGYGLLRFVTEYFRSEPFEVGPFTRGQVASLVVAVIGAGLMWIVNNRERR